jgi:iron complex transport system substrate-binding protein
VRICSLLPSSTEIVFALGLGDSLVGVTHECDYPPEARSVRKITRSCIPAAASSSEIDRLVSTALSSAGSLYELDVAALEELAPDLILTQRLCDVCAVPYDRVQEAVTELPSRPRVVNLEPHGLADILENIRLVGRVTNRERVAEDVVGALERRIHRVRERTSAAAKRPRVVCLEWVDPPYCGGHWMKELVDLAGGVDDLAHHLRPSCRIPWQKIRSFAPEVIVLTCCGFDLERSKREGEILCSFEGFSELPAAQDSHVFATNGSAYFSRPGPRIVDSLEILAHLIHPELFSAPPLEDAFTRLEFSRLALP